MLDRGVLAVAGIAARVRAENLCRSSVAGKPEVAPLIGESLDVFDGEFDIQKVSLVLASLIDGSFGRGLADFQSENGFIGPFACFNKLAIRRRFGEYVPERKRTGTVIHADARAQ